MYKTFLIAGDSWGCGEWNNHTIQHAGLAQYLTDDGHSVINISRPAGSNYDTWNRLENFLMSNPYIQIDEVYVFQTEWDRELLFQQSEVLPAISVEQLLTPAKISYSQALADQAKIGTVTGIGALLISNFYEQLSRISDCYKVHINLIGGRSDAVITDDYRGVSTVCQSMTNLIITGDHQTNQPVYSFYTSESVMEFIKKHNRDVDTLAELLNNIDQSQHRAASLYDYPEYFYPDWRHPNRVGHRILYDFLMVDQKRH